MKDTSFAKTFEELEKITQSFEKGSFDLDEGLKQFERGLELAAALKKKLSDIENKVEVIKKKFAKEFDKNASTSNDQDANESLPF